jgi:hypothetical protein
MGCHIGNRAPAEVETSDVSYQLDASIQNVTCGLFGHKFSVLPNDAMKLILKP